VFKVLLGDEAATGEPLPGKLPHGSAHVKQGLLAFVDWVHKLSGVAFQIQPLEALEASHKPGFRKLLLGTLSHVAAILDYREHPKELDVLQRHRKHSPS
jgi:hypothetical protein